MNSVSTTPLVAISAPVAAELQTYRRLFESTLSHSDSMLHNALGYIRSREGKMMRPILVLLIAREAGVINKKVLISAVSLELLHTASLVHDDVVDESDLRRGHASVNQKYGNKIAVLVGDYLLARLLTKAAETGDTRIVSRIAQLGGTLSEGEIYQLSTSQHDIPDEASYFRIIHHKTAALFATCGELGAVAAQADESFVETAKRFGELIGICFQIRDDIFDYFADATIGKPTGNDLLEGKFTLPIIHALHTAPSPTLLPLIERVKTCSATREDVATLVEYTKSHGGISYAVSLMENYRNEALKLLDSFKDEQVRAALEAYANYVTERNF